MTSKIPNEFNTKIVKGIKGFSLCSFLIGLEGWRRGLTLKYYGEINQYSNIYTKGRKPFGRSYSLESKSKIHYFNQSRGDLVSNEAVKIAESKHKTKEYLKRHNIPVMPSMEFTENVSDQEIIQRVKEFGFPVIIKPTYGTLSRGVVLNIKNDTKLEESLTLVREKLGFKNIIVERYFEGEDIRLYVVNQVVVAALRRVPAKVTGDGKSTIKQLIQAKNKTRRNNPYLAARPVKLDEEVISVLKRNNYELDSILEDGKTILVKNKSTMNQGVDLYDITDEVKSHIKRLAINTLNALPNIPHGSIDMLYNGEEAVVLEVNPSANISMHMFPTEGKSRNVGAYLMDFYFPETKEKSGKHANMYFDLLDIVDILKRNYTNYIEVKSLPESPIYAKRYVISGTVQNVGYRNWIKRQATLENLHGFAKNLNNGNVEVVVASSVQQKINGFEKKCIKGSKKSIVENVEGFNWDKEIKMGFEIVSTPNKKKKTPSSPIKKKVTLIERVKKLIK